MKQMKQKIKSFWNYLMISIKRPEMEVLPGNLSFNFMMMLIPLFTLIGIVITNINVETGNIKDVILNNFPDNVADLIIAISGQSSSAIGVGALLFGSLLLAANGTYSMIVTSDSIYGLKPKAIRNRVKSVILMVVLILLFVMLLIIPIINNKVLEFVGQITNTDIATNLYVLLYRVLRYPVIFIFVFIFVQILYKFSMNCKPKKKTMYGSVFTSILLMISTWGYSVYMEYFTDFESYYGGVATLLSLMIYLNLISLVFVLGMSINYARDKIMNGEESNKKEIKKDKAQ